MKNITLIEDRVFSINEAESIIEEAIQNGTTKNTKQIEYYNIICAFDIETTSFKDEAPIQPVNTVLYNFLKNAVINAFMIDHLYYQSLVCGNMQITDDKGTMLPEFYLQLQTLFGDDLFPDTLDHDEMIQTIIAAHNNNKPLMDDLIKHALMYCWQFAINGKVIFGRTWNEFLILLGIIERYTDKNKRLLVYIHNESFEFGFMAPYIKWDKIFAVAPRKPIYAITESGIEFRCSYILTNYSLAKLAEQLREYKIRKLVGELDYSLKRHPETPMTWNEIQYCINDVLIVSAYIQECINKEGDITKIPLTATGYCRRYCSNKCLSADKKNRGKQYKEYINLMHSLTISGKEEYYQMTRAFQGGFTHANAHYSGKIMHECDSLDFTSAYPFTAVSELMPMSSGKIVHPKTTEEFEKYLKYYCCIFDVEIWGLSPKFTHEHYISISHCYIKEDAIIDNGRIASADHIALTITNVDYEIIRKCYHIRKMRIRNFRIYRKGYLPKPLIEAIISLYKNKTVLKGVDGKEEEYMNSKALLNAVYGMMVTSISKPLFTYKNGKWGYDKADIEMDIEKYNKSKKRFLFYAWGIFITAYCRKNLWSGIFEFGEDYIYSDTDSIKCKNLSDHMDYVNNYNRNCLKKLKIMCKHHGLDFNDFIPKTIKGDTKPLGVWDIETKKGKMTNFKTLGAKRYLYDINGEYHLTVAGVGKKTALPYMLNRFKDNIYDEFKISLVIPAEYTGKLTHIYIERFDMGTIIDYLGNAYEYNIRSGVYLEKQEYNFDISNDYFKYLKGIHEHEIL